MKRDTVLKIAKGLKNPKFRNIGINNHGILPHFNQISCS